MVVVASTDRMTAGGFHCVVENTPVDDHDDRSTYEYEFMWHLRIMSEAHMNSHDVGAFAYGDRSTYEGRDLCY